MLLRGWEISVYIHVVCHMIYEDLVVDAWSLHALHNFYKATVRL